MAAWNRKTLKYLRFFFAFFEQRPLTVKFSKFCFKGFYRDTDRHAVFIFREIWLTGNRWNRALLTWQKTEFRLALQLSLLRGSHPKSARASLQPRTEKCSRFHPNRFTFGGVIAERANTAKTCWKVNPMFGWRLASNRIISRLISQNVFRKRLQRIGRKCFTLCLDIQTMPR